MGEREREGEGERCTLGIPKKKKEKESSSPPGLPDGLFHDPLGQFWILVKNNLFKVNIYR